MFLLTFLSRASSKVLALCGGMGGLFGGRSDSGIAVVGEVPAITPRACDFVNTSSLEDAMRGPAKFGTLISALFLCVFCVWAGFAPLSSSVVAGGQVTFGEQAKQYIQTTEVCQISEVLVKEGDQVVRGQALVKLDDINSAASVQILRNALFSLELSSMRLQAELDNKEELIIPEYMLAKAQGSDELKNIISNQIKMFDVRNAVHKGHRSLLEQNKITADQEIAGLTARLVEEKKRLAYADEELRGLRDLVKQGYAPKNRLMEAESRRLSIVQNIAGYETNISKTKEELMSLDIRLLNLNYDNAQEVERELLAANDRIVEVSEKKKVAERDLSRAVVVSPVDGVVNNMKATFVGSVLRPGENIMEIVPNEKDLVVEAHLPRDSIDSILGKTENIANYGSDGKLVDAQIRLPAYSGRWRKPLRAVVTYVAADTEPQQNYGMMGRPGASTYIIRLRILDEDLQKSPDIKLYPGMAAEVFVITGSRTMLSYLFEPVLGVLRHSMTD